MNPAEWIKPSEKCPFEVDSEASKDLLPRSFVGFLRYLTLDLSPEELRVDWLPEDWYRTALIE